MTDQEPSLTEHRSSTGTALRPVLVAIVLTAAMAIGNLVQFALGTLGPLLTEDLGLSRTQLGSLTSVYFIGGVLLSARMGGLVDRFGGRTMILVLFAGVTFALTGMASAPNYGWLLVATALAALPLAISNPATNQVVAVRVPPGRQGVTLGVKQSGVQVSATLAGVALPGAAVAFGWRPTLVAAAVLSLAGIVATVWVLPPVNRRPPPRSEPDDAPRPLPPDVRWLAGYAALMGAGLAALITYLPLYGTEAVGLSVTRAGAVAGLMGFFGIPGRILWARHAERTGSTRRPLLIMAAVATAASAGLLVAPAFPMTLWVSAAALGLSAGSWLSVAMLAVVRDVPTSTSGRASGVVLAGFYIGMLSSPTAIGWIIDTTGSYQAAWTLVMAGSAASGILTLLWSRRQGAHRAGRRHTDTYRGADDEFG